MNQGNHVGVAISTTGHEHRMEFLETAVQEWTRLAGPQATLVVTVDGPPEAVGQVQRVLGPHTAVLWVGRPRPDCPIEPRHGRLGVAANKNTGIEFLMDAGVNHLFLADDDVYPRHTRALDLHKHGRRNMLEHSIVAWGAHRLSRAHRNYASWSWPRGVVQYATRHVINAVGGMREEFSPGGHEHVEWSRRIHNAGLTPVPFPSPKPYASLNGRGASLFWVSNDMPGKRESADVFSKRKEAQTSIEREDGDWKRLSALLDATKHSRSFVSYRASENGRESATMC